MNLSWSNRDSPTEDFPFDTVCWTSKEFRFVLRVAITVPRLTDLHIVIPTSVGVSLPIAGLTKDDRSMTISANATFGNVVSTSILNSPAVGVVYSPSLSFAPDDAGQPSKIELKFVLGMALEWQETMTLHLPGFFSGSADDQPPHSVREFRLEPTPKRRFEKATWNPATEDMVLTAAVPLTKGAVIDEIFRTPINLPLNGIRNYSTGMTIRTDANDGPIPATVIPNFNWIGSMRYSELRLSPHIPGATVEITLLFVPQMLVAAGTTVDVILEGFSGPKLSGGSFIDFNVSHPSISEVTWLNESKTLTLAIQSSISENELVQLTLSSAANIRIPSAGLLPNVPSFKIASVQEAGSVGASGRGTNPLWRSPGIQHAGRILKSSMSFDGEGGPHANTAVDVEVKFIATVTIFPGDVIILILPRFTASGSVLQANLSYGFNEPEFAPQPRSGGLEPIFSQTSAMWSSEAGTLSVQVNYELPGGVEATISVPKKSLLKLPLDGVNANQAALRIAVTADAGIVNQTSIEHSPSIGSVSDTSSLSFHPAKAAETTDITFQFATNMRVCVPSGLKWVISGTIRPIDGRELFHPDLVAALTLQNGPVFTFTNREWEAFGITDLRSDDFIQGDMPFRDFETGVITITTYYFVPADMQIEEEPRLFLPLFGQSQAVFNTSDSSHTFPTASWDNSTSTIIFKCSKTLEENVLVTMLLPNFTLPSIGVRRNQRTITMSINARDGPMLPTTIIRTQGIGSMTNSTSLSFVPLGSGIDLDVKFQFVPEMDLATGDKIRLSLPGFYRSSPDNRGFEYECTSSFNDSLGFTHCSGEYQCSRKRRGIHAANQHFQCHGDRFIPSGRPRLLCPSGKRGDWNFFSVPDINHDGD